MDLLGPSEIQILRNCLSHRGSPKVERGVLGENTTIGTCVSTFQGHPQVRLDFFTVEAFLQESLGKQRIWEAAR